MQTSAHAESGGSALRELPFSIGVSRRGRTPVSVARVAGDLDASHVAALDQTLAELSVAGHGRVVVELSRVPFIGSVGWKALLSKVSAARQHGGGIALAGLSAYARHVHEMLDLQSHLPAYDTETEAVDSFHH